MKEYTTYGSKDITTKIAYIGAGLIFLISLNMLIFGLSFGGSLYFYLLLSIFFGYIFYKMYKILKFLKYNFTTNGIKIYISNTKSYFLDINDIQDYQIIERLPLLSGFGIKYNFFTKEVYFTSSNSNILKLFMNDGRKILISPKIINEDFLKLIK